jgi:hypothetical protein
VCLVREDGTKASNHGNYKRAQQTCRELETKYGLEELSNVHATRGYDQQALPDEGPSVSTGVGRI